MRSSEILKEFEDICYICGKKAHNFMYKKDKKVCLNCGLKEGSE